MGVHMNLADLIEDARDFTARGYSPADIRICLATKIDEDGQRYPEGKTRTDDVGALLVDEEEGELHLIPVSNLEDSFGCLTVADCIQLVEANSSAKELCLLARVDFYSEAEKLDAYYTTPLVGSLTCRSHQVGVYMQLLQFPLEQWRDELQRGVHEA